MELRYRRGKLQTKGEWRDLQGVGIALLEVVELHRVHDARQPLRDVDRFHLCQRHLPHQLQQSVSAQLSK